MPFACSIRARRPKHPEALVLAEALERDVDRALQLVGRAVDDVGEDAALGGLVDVGGSSAWRIAITGQDGLAHDLGDQIERVLRARPEPDQSDVGMLPRGDRADLLDVDLAGDHVVPEPITTWASSSSRSRLSFAIRTRRCWHIVLGHGLVRVQVCRIRPPSKGANLRLSVPYTSALRSACRVSDVVARRNVLPQTLAGWSGSAGPSQLVGDEPPDPGVDMIEAPPSPFRRWTNAHASFARTPGRSRSSLPNRHATDLPARVHRPVVPGGDRAGLRVDRPPAASGDRRRLGRRASVDLRRWLEAAGSPRQPRLRRPRICSAHPATLPVQTRRGVDPRLSTLSRTKTEPPPVPAAGPSAAGTPDRELREHQDGARRIAARWRAHGPGLCREETNSLSIATLAQLDQAACSGCMS